MVLAAGLGTRLAPYTKSHPKPLLPLLDVPIIEPTLRRLAAAGIRNIVVNAFHHADGLEQFVAGLATELAPRHPGLTLHVSREEALLGTGGGIARARRLFDGLPLLVVNGDVLWDFDVPLLLRRHAAAAGPATLLLHPGASPAAPRTTRVARDGRVTAIQPRGGGPDACVFTGIYVLEPAVYRMLPERFCSVVEEGLWPALQQDLRVTAEVADFPWFDLGTWAQVLEAAHAVLTSAGDRFGLLRSLAPGEFRFPAESGAEGAYVGPLAKVASGACVGPGTIVSSGSQLGTAARVERVLLLPGATVDGELSDAVAGPGWVVRRG